MMSGYYKVPTPVNEPVKAYLPGSKERKELKAELERQSNQIVTIPLIIGGKEVYTENYKEVVMPHEHKHVIARYCVAGKAELRMAISAAMNAKEKWANMPFEQRCAIFLKAAEIISGPSRAKLNAATMLGQSKTVVQAEIDSACELCDFLRFNAYYAQGIYEQQPNQSKNVWNRNEYRPLDGFVMAITPFNFTAIACNLPYSPALMGNTVIWKPSSTAVLSNYYVMQALMQAGLPSGVINFIPSRGTDVSKYVLTDKNLAGFHFTGSTEVFQNVWKLVGNNIHRYRNYPRLVGETGGKDFVFVHASANVNAVVAALVRGSFEYQGQKCSAASRAYIPASLWGEVKEKMLNIIKGLKQGDVRDFTTFLSAVIDKNSFENLVKYIDDAKISGDCELLCGGYDGSKGYFIYPTVIQAFKPDYVTMTTELFGPVLTVYVYDDKDLDKTLKLCDTSSPYALTGSIFADDREAVLYMERKLVNAAGNFYINDKPTGAVVSQQPFGGSRASGTNDKAGSYLNLLRWVSPRTIKESFVSPTDIEYPYMEEK
ncbi:MAG: L-glutamate gamma-semialdehyde dehydrogenase [Clostridia bacterium]|nr:L-glutamate gamma-semialdehyde dehydrogenase [Clostridia bacterium]